MKLIRSIQVLSAERAFEFPSQTVFIQLTYIYISNGIYIQEEEAYKPSLLFLNRLMILVKLISS